MDERGRERERRAGLSLREIRGRRKEPHKIIVGVYRNGRRIQEMRDGHTRDDEEEDGIK